MPKSDVAQLPPLWIVFLVPCALLVMTFLPGLNDGFWRVDNPLYAAISKFAYESGSLWTLYAGEQHYFNKPPLVFWVHGAVLHAFGAELWAARLPSLFVALSTLLLSIDAVRRLTGPYAAMASGIVLALTLEYFRAMHSISLDLWIGLAVTGGAWCVIRGVISGRVLLWSIGAGVFIGAGLMTKPLLALAALPFFAIWLGVTRQWRALAFMPLIAAVAVAVALPWHVSMGMLHAELFWNEYFGSQVMDRVTTDAHGSSPWWSYLGTIGQTYWPWLIAFACGAWLLWGDRARAGERPALWFGVVFSIGWVVMLSVSQDKAGRYLIPAYPFASWVGGVWLARAFPMTRRTDRLARVAIVGAPAIGLLLALFGPAPHQPISQPWRELRDFVRAHPDDDFVIDPRSRTLGAQVYLMRNRWPGVAKWNAGVGEDAGGGLPPAGTLMVSRRHAVLWARPGDQTVFENAEFIVWRLSTDWDGNYAVRSLEPGAE